MCVCVCVCVCISVCMYGCAYLILFGLYVCTFRCIHVSVCHYDPVLIHREGWKVCQFVWCFLLKSLHHIHRPKVSSNPYRSVSNKSLLVKYVLQLSPWSSDTRSLLSSLFFLKRLQAMQEFFHMVTQLAAALQGTIVYFSLYSLSPPLCMISYIALGFTWSLPSPLYDLIYCTWLYMISPLPTVWPHILHFSWHDLCPPLCMTS